MESGEISITRTNHSAIFPARFILALAANPCPCGKFAGRGRGCECSSLQVRKYLGKLSGPLLDRIDLRIRIEAPTRLELSTESSESSSIIRKRVIKARFLAAERFSGEIFSTNSQIPPSLLRNKFRATRDGMTLLNNLLDQEAITARSFHRILRTSWSIADLDEIEIPGKREIEMALSLRTGLGSE
jgi:magnesium chelatase family protein